MIFLKNIKFEQKKSFEKLPNLKKAKEMYKYILFFPSRPIEEKGGKYLLELARKLDNKEFGIIGPFSNEKKLPEYRNSGRIKGKSGKRHK